MKKEEIEKLLEPDIPEFLLYEAETAITAGLIAVYKLSILEKGIPHLDTVSQIELGLMTGIPALLTYAAIRGYKLLEHFSDSLKKKNL